MLQPTVSLADKWGVAKVPPRPPAPPFFLKCHGLTTGSTRSQRLQRAWSSLTSPHHSHTFSLLCSAELQTRSVFIRRPLTVTAHFALPCLVSWSCFVGSEGEKRRSRRSSDAFKLRVDGRRQKSGALGFLMPFWMLTRQIGSISSKKRQIFVLLSSSTLNLVWHLHKTVLLCTVSLKLTFPTKSADWSEVPADAWRIPVLSVYSSFAHHQLWTHARSGNYELRLHVRRPLINELMHHEWPRGLSQSSLLGSGILTRSPLDEKIVQPWLQSLHLITGISDFSLFAARSITTALKHQSLSACHGRHFHCTQSAFFSSVVEPYN